MSLERLKKFIPSPVPVVLLTLIGLLLLSALLYYKAVRAQRYLEPSLALAQPRIEFTHNISQLFEKEFGPMKIEGVVLSGNSIFVDDSLIFSGPVMRKVIDRVFLKKLSNIFLSMLRDSEMRSHFDLILISTRIDFSPSMAENNKRRVTGQHISESIVDSLYKVEPVLAKYYGIFAPTAVPDRPDKKHNWVEFRIVPSERVHIEMMKSLNKYIF